MTWALVDDGRKVCGAPVGANRCRLDPHDTGRHDVAPDRLWARLEVTGTRECRDRMTQCPLWPSPCIACESPGPGAGLRRVSARAELRPLCPATGRECSCRPDERCHPAVRTGR